MVEFHSISHDILPEVWTLELQTIFQWILTYTFKMSKEFLMNIPKPLQ